MIIDTGKRETRYQLVKLHQTIRRPHSDHMDCSPPGSSVHEILINVAVLKIYDQALVTLDKLSTESIMSEFKNPLYIKRF